MSQPTQRLQNSWIITSPSWEEWQYQKAYEGGSNVHLDSMMEAAGLEAVKKHFLRIKAKVETSVRQGVNLRNESFGAVFLGNPGTGKTTAARLYAQFLISLRILPGSRFEEVTAARLATEGVKWFETLIEKVCRKGGGVIFIDEAYQLVSSGNTSGEKILDFLLPEVVNRRGEVVFILAGYRKQMETLMAYNPGFQSRFPHQFQFQDYENAELLHIFKLQLGTLFGGRMNVEGGPNGLYCRVVARRIGYGRGREGFGNARAVEIALSRIRDRQAQRLMLLRRQGGQPDDMMLTQSDLLGPEPIGALADSAAWKKLDSMTGLDAVKQSVKAFIETTQYNYHRELEEKPILEFNLNKVFLGSPGTGKTTVAKLYGQILVDIGFLSDGEVVVKNPSDFIGDVIGASEKLTKGIIASTVGKVLVIDEAYALNPKASGSNTGSFKTAVIDTIVAEVQSMPGDDRCVILIGYKDQMEDMLQCVNPGLSRRFPLGDAFDFEDFTIQQLEEILLGKLVQQGYNATDQAIKVALEVLDRTRNRPNFGNAGEVDILLNSAKLRHQQRMSKNKTTKGSLLEAVDMDPEFDRGQQATTNTRQLFEGLVGCDESAAKFAGYQRITANVKARGLDPRDYIPFNMLFRGPPGTGKTTTARKMGQIYYDMGFLAKAEVIEASATDMVGEYIGQTGPKTKKLLERALGRVLLIDEAYRLGEGRFAQEALDELVDCLTKPQFERRLIVILAGYDKDINRLMLQNPGLTSRFPDTLNFRDFTPSECLELFGNEIQDLLQRVNIEVPSVSSRDSARLLKRLEQLSGTVNWANARDVKFLANSVFRQLMQGEDSSSGQLSLTMPLISHVVDNMLAERVGRMTNTSKQDKKISDESQEAMDSGDPPIIFNCNTTSTNNPKAIKPVIPQTEKLPPPPPSNELSKSPPRHDTRDLGVSDYTWANLSHSKTQAALAEKAHQANLAELARLEKQKSRLAQKEREKLERLRKECEERNKENQKEEAMQRKLRDLGRCSQGFRWTKQSHGYRCAGGGHWVSNADL
ncbi:P-loop containing nucleoside triphosphate hydrolase protein [Aureobasidium pullulans]|uniref:P-loop containing nucleoside triphosphate hydrolase protein n=1 Tax=Aureobasidium pullulans TaxID=5580 RepID=A0A4S9B6H2_AURPU|nr:P-loop containing nucleoside triphosphate hydrolase protein [Aureobasidium pullulans]